MESSMQAPKQYFWLKKLLLMAHAWTQPYERCPLPSSALWLLLSCLGERPSTFVWGLRQAWCWAGSYSRCCRTVRQLVFNDSVFPVKLGVLLWFVADLVGDGFAGSWNSSTPDWVMDGFVQTLVPTMLSAQQLPPWTAILPSWWWVRRVVSSEQGSPGISTHQDPGHRCNMESFPVLAWRWSLWGVL